MDGDLDLTVAISSNAESFIENLATFLKGYHDGKRKENMKIQVTGVVLNASVPLVKLLINNELPMDVSANSFRGVPAVCFLEAVDRKFGRNHIFKRTILFTKAWLKHESEIILLDSSNGLLSSFALEILLLFIINRFYIEGNTPLELMAKFFDYFSFFKWETHAITVRGPIQLTDLCRVEEDKARLLLDEEFLRECMNSYSFGESTGSFDVRQINIVDPLNVTNNIGKSVIKHVQFRQGLASGNKKLALILARKEISPEQFPILRSKFSESDEDEWLNLEGDFDDMVVDLRQAKEFHLTTPPMSKKTRNYDEPKVGVRSRPRVGGTVKGKGHTCAVEMQKLTSTLVFTSATASPSQVLQIDQSALAGNSTFKLPLAVPKFLTLEEARASIIVLHSLLQVRGVSGGSLAGVSDTLTKCAHTTFDLEFDRKEHFDFCKNSWPDVITRAICALLDHSASSLHQLADVSAALSCEALKTDPTIAFNLFKDSGDCFSDKDRASVASDMRALLHGSKMSGGKTQCNDAICDIPVTHGRLRSLCRSIRSSTQVELNSVPLVHGVASKDLTGLVASMAFALESVGEGSWQRAKLCVDNFLKDNSFHHLAESFSKGCPNFDNLKLLIRAFVKAKEEQLYVQSMHEVYNLSEAVRKILSWEVTVAYISLEGSKQRKKKALGKGTTVLMEFIKDRLQSVIKNSEAASLPEVLSNAFLSLLDFKDARLAELLKNLKEVISSNGSTRLPLGTNDFAKEQMANREKTLSIVKHVFERHGAIPLDTPVMELRETLLGKYGEDSKLIYDLADQGEELCSLRYDLTVPFARYVAMNGITSFRRYQIAKVYRRDIPSTGSYREFYQCDFDIAGDATLGADFEVVKILTELLDELNIGEYEIKLNHRKLLDGMLDICGVPSHKFRTVCSSIDKLDKQTFEQIRKELIDEKGLDTETVEKIGSFVKLKGDPSDLLLEFMKEGSEFVKNDSSKQALIELGKLFQALKSAGCVEKVVLDLSLARGLDYYTGLIYEAIIKGDTEVGSIAGGGRYDNLIGMFGKKHVAAIGVCLGIERVFTLMEQSQKEDKQMVRASETHVLVSVFSEDLSLAAKLVSKCWSANLKASFLVSKRQSKHFDRAKELGIPWIVMVGEREASKGLVTLKNKDAGVEKQVSQSSFVEELLSLINNWKS